MSEPLTMCLYLSRGTPLITKASAAGISGKRTRTRYLVRDRQAFLTSQKQSKRGGDIRFIPSNSPSSRRQIRWILWR